MFLFEFYSENENFKSCYLAPAKSLINIHRSGFCNIIQLPDCWLILKYFSDNSILVMRFFDLFRLNL